MQGKRLHKIGLIGALATSLFFPLASSTTAADDSIKLIVNVQQIQPDVPPQTIDGRTMVPVRWVGEALGAKVDWNEANQTVLINSSADQITSKSDQIQLIVNGKVVQPDVAPRVIDGRTLVPVRWVAEALGAQVDWNETARVVIITGAGRTGVTVIPSIKYPGEYLEVADDELLIITEGNNQWELDGIIDELFADKLREHFPDMKIKFVAWDKPLRWDDFDALGIAPDIVITLSRTFIDGTLERRNWQYDMTELIQEYGIDLSRMNQGAVEMIKSRSDGGMYGVPFFINEYIMFYNKTIFDKFGVEYPRNGMTYDEVYELMKKVTGQVGVVNYKGYTQHPDQYLDFNQLGLYPFTPGDTEEPTGEQLKASVNINTPEWLALVENLYRFLSYPGNGYNSVPSDFFQNQKAAMGIDTLTALPPYLGMDRFVEERFVEMYDKWASTLNIGAVSVPVFAEAPNSIYQPNLYGLHLTKPSTKKEMAMEVIKYLVSDEYQLHLSQHGLKSIYNTEEIKHAFGDAFPEFARVEGLKEAVYWGENAKVKNYENTEWPYGFPLYYVFREYILKQGNTPEAALHNAQHEGIANWYQWATYDEDFLKPLGLMN